VNKFSKLNRIVQRACGVPHTYARHLANLQHFPVNLNRKDSQCAKDERVCRHCFPAAGPTIGNAAPSDDGPPLAKRLT
jgi:hypothetical protein